MWYHIQCKMKKNFYRKQNKNIDHLMFTTIRIPQHFYKKEQSEFLNFTFTHFIKQLELIIIMLKTANIILQAQHHN